MCTKFPILTLLALGIVVLFTCGSALADNDKPIARVLDPGGYDEYTFKSCGNEILIAKIESDIYQSRGRKAGSEGGCSDGGGEGGCSGSEGGSEGGSDGCSCGDTTTASTTGSTEGGEGGCSGSEGGTSEGGEGGCSEGGEGGCSGSGGAGPGDMCLQVLDPDGQKICWAGRPTRPGWMRDPRLACEIPEGFCEAEGEGCCEQEFTLRVFRGQCGNHDMGAVTPLADGEKIVYLLYYQLYKAAK